MLALPCSTHFVSTSQSRPFTKLQTRTQHKPNIHPATREKKRSTRDAFGKRDVVDPSIAKLRFMLRDCIAASIHVRLTFAKLRCLNLAGQHMFYQHVMWIIGAGSETRRREGWKWVESTVSWHDLPKALCEHGEYTAWNRTNSKARMKCLQPGLVTITIVNLTLCVMDVQ